MLKIYHSFIHLNLCSKNITAERKAIALKDADQHSQTAQGNRNWIMRKELSILCVAAWLSILISFCINLPVTLLSWADTNHNTLRNWIMRKELSILCSCMTVSILISFCINLPVTFLSWADTDHNTLRNFIMGKGLPILCVAAWLSILISFCINLPVTLLCWANTNHNTLRQPRPFEQVHALSLLNNLSTKKKTENKMQCITI